MANATVPVKPAPQVVHGLAFIEGALLWRADPKCSWHLAAAAVHVPLGTSNLVFWRWTG